MQDQTSDYEMVHHGVIRSFRVSTTEVDMEQRSPTPNTISFSVNQSDQLVHSTNDNEKESCENDMQHGLSNHHIVMMNNLTANQQRPSVIKWVGAESSSGKDCNKTFFTRNYFSSQGANGTIDSVNKPSSSEHNEYKYRCLFCGKTFKWYSHWQAHERIHTGERPFKCDMCSKAFTRSDGLQSHKLTHATKKTSCSFSRSSRIDVKDISCEDDFKDENTFAPDTHKETKPFTCNFCGRNFLSSLGLTNHVQEHKGRKEFKCEVCNMIFIKQSALEIHSRVHTGLRPYRCSICGRTFSIYGNLKRHLLIHTGERPYACSECSSSFNNPSHLTRHIKKKHVNA